MLIYKYKAISFDGKKENGAIIAENQLEAFKKLKLKKYHPISLEKKKISTNKVKAEELLILFMHIDFQLKCGVSINKAIESFLSFHFNEELSASLAKVLSSLKSGMNLSVAFESCADIFGDTILGLLKASEKTGKLGVSVSNILNFLKLESQWKQDIRNALMYPCFLLLLSIFVLLFSLNILGPQIADFFKNFQNYNLDSYPLTKFALSIPDYYKEISCLLVLLIVFSISIFSNKKYREYFLNKIISIPKMGDLIAKIFIWKSCKIIEIAISAKLEFIDALNLALKSQNLEDIQTEFNKAKQQIIAGFSVSSAFANMRYMPKDILVAIYIGEDSNNLKDAFSHITSSIYNDILYKINVLGKTLSVSFTILTGLVFVFIVFSLIYPIYDLVDFRV